MNPFSHKQLEEFSIADCELYISKYPYGEHVFKVKDRLRNLKKQQKEESPKEPKEESKKDPQKDKKPKETMKPYKPNSGDKKPSGGRAQSAIQTKDDTQSNDVAQTIFARIGVIAVVLIVGTIIITILNNILPYNWWNKYKYVIYAIGLAIGRLTQKKNG